MLPFVLSLVLITIALVNDVIEASSNDVFSSNVQEIAQLAREGKLSDQKIGKINFLHNSIKLPNGVFDEQVNQIRNILNSVEKEAIDLGKELLNCQTHRSTSKICSIVVKKTEALNSRFMNDLEFFKQNIGNYRKAANEPTQARCFTCISSFLHSVLSAFNQYMVQFGLNFSVGRPITETSPTSESTTASEVAVNSTIANDSESTTNSHGLAQTTVSTTMSTAMATLSSEVPSSAVPPSDSPSSEAPPTEAPSMSAKII